MSNIQQLTPHLMFQNGRAEEALQFYVQLFDGEVLMLLHYEDDTQGTRGQVQIATFSIAGQQINIMDSSVQHAFEFTPSMSLFFRCTSLAEFDHLWAALAEDGQILMPKSDYGFGPYGWLNDRYGVSWQLSFDAGQSTMSEAQQA